MKTLGPNTTALFAARQFNMANLFNFSLIDGTQLNYCSGDVDVQLNTSAPNSDVESWWSNQTFSSGGTVGPFFDRSDNKFKAHCKVGVEVDTIQFDCIPGSALVEGTPLLSAVREGVFDGAECTVYGAYWPKVTLQNACGSGDTTVTVSGLWNAPSSTPFYLYANDGVNAPEIMQVTAGATTLVLTVTRGALGTTAVAHNAGAAVYYTSGALLQPVVPTGTIIKMVGRVAQVDCGRSITTFSVNSHLELLNQNMPRNLWQAGCVNTLYDVSCTLSQASFQHSGAATSGSTSLVINDTTLAQASGYYSLGVMKFTSGVNSGLVRGVSLYTSGSPNSIALMQPFPNAPAPGDTFVIAAGCDKQMSTCSGKFSNLVNFRGMPYVPDATTAV